MSSINVWIVVVVTVHRKRKTKMHISTNERKKNTQLQILHHNAHIHTNTDTQRERVHGASKIKYICYSFNNHEPNRVRESVDSKGEQEPRQEKERRTQTERRITVLCYFFRGLLREMQTNKENFFLCVSFF